MLETKLERITQQLSPSNYLKANNYFTGLDICRLFHSLDTSFPIAQALRQIRKQEKRIMRMKLMYLQRIREAKVIQIALSLMSLPRNASQYSLHFLLIIIGQKNYFHGVTVYCPARLITDLLSRNNIRRIKFQDIIGKDQAQGSKSIMVFKRAFF